MGHFTGPRSKIARRFGEPIFGPDKVLEKRPNPPGQHGATKRRHKLSEYGEQLREKQKAKAIYGMREGQFRLFFERAKVDAAHTKGEAFLALLGRIKNPNRSAREILLTAPLVVRESTRRVKPVKKIGRETTRKRTKR